MFLNGFRIATVILVFHAPSISDKSIKSLWLELFLLIICSLLPTCDLNILIILNPHIPHLLYISPTRSTPLPGRFLSVVNAISPRLTVGMKVSYLGMSNQLSLIVNTLSNQGSMEWNSFHFNVKCDWYRECFCLKYRSLEGILMPSQYN